MGCLPRRDTSVIVGENPEPAAFGPSDLFKNNNIQLLSDTTELLPGEPVCCTSFFDEGCRRRSGRQYIQHESSSIGALVRLFDHLFDWRRSIPIQSFK